MGTAHPSRSSGTPGLGRAFTLVEVLVALSIIVLVIVLALPALSTARRSGRNTESLSMLRQLTAGLRMYADASRDAFPYAGVPGDVHANTTYRGYEIATIEDSLSAQSRYWPTLVAPEFLDVPARAIEFPGTRELLESRGFPPWIIRSRFFLTFTAFVAPEGWTDGDPPSPSVFRAVRWSEVSYPSRKGLLVDFGAGGFVDRGADLHNAFVSFADGSARSVSWFNIDSSLICYPPFAPFSGSNMTTRHGVRGLDSP